MKLDCDINNKYMMEYVGARWLKCDFHLHTPASQCFKDKNVTPEMWVQACLDQKLDCVAVTDHNTHAWVDAVKTAAEGKAGQSKAPFRCPCCFSRTRSAKRPVPAC